MTVLPYAALLALGLFVPMVREMRTTYYQFDRPFIIDAQRAVDAFGFAPEPLEVALRETAEMLRKAV